MTLMTADAKAVLQVLRDEGSPRDAQELALASGIVGGRFESAVAELEGVGVVELMHETGPRTGYPFSAVRLLIDDD
jgi:hypothetical protein